MDSNGTFKIVFGAFGVSPEEAGFTENSNRATGDSQERVTVRNALSPYYKMLETSINNRLIPEILQDANPKVKFEYCPKDQEKKKTEVIIKKKFKLSVGIKDMFEAGCHLGHRSSKTNPKAKENIFDTRKGVEIFDLPKTINF